MSIDIDTMTNTMDNTQDNSDVINITPNSESIMMECDYPDHPDYDINPMVDDDGYLW